MTDVWLVPGGGGPSVLSLLKVQMFEVISAGLKILQCFLTLLRWTICSHSVHSDLS